MSSPIEKCNVEEQRYVIRFLVAEGVTGSRIHARVLQVNGNNCINQANIYREQEHGTGNISVGTV